MSGVFKAYDVRGIYPSEINEDLAYKIGKAYVQFLGAKKLVIGMDMRESSMSLTSSLIEGIREMGCDVEFLDLVSTPITYFATNYYKSDGAIMVTASHNPKEYNGFKFSREHAIPVGQDTGLLDIETLVKEDNFTKSPQRGNIIRVNNVLKDYERFIVSKLNLKKPLKIVVDASNGMAGHVLPKVFSQVDNLEILDIHFKLDGNFPNHEANPIKSENYRDLKLVMRATQADLGVMFDGDADRIGFIDHNLNIIPADIMTAFLADNLLPLETINKEVIYDIRSSRVVEEVILKQGGKATLNKVGHSFMKKTLREHDAVFGGELAGHFYFRDFFYADSAIFMLVKVLNILSSTPISFHELTKQYTKYFGSGEINFEVKDATLTLNNIIKLAQSEKDANINLIDGLRVDYPDYWVSIRKSNTEPLLRLVVEATTEEILKEKTEYFINLINS